MEEDELTAQSNSLMKRGVWLGLVRKLERRDKVTTLARKRKGWIKEQLLERRKG